MNKSFIRQLLLPSCFAIILVFLYRFYSNCEYNFKWDNIFSILNIIKIYPAKNYHSPTLYSSVFCRGSNHTNRLCRFRNLCFEPKTESFVFLNSPLSVRIGIPDDRFSPALTDFSSVSDHNTLYFNYIELPNISTENFTISFIEGYGLLFKRFNPDNLMHVFHDDLLPIFVTLDELSILTNPETFLVIADSRPVGAYAGLYENILQTKPLYLQLLSQDSLHCFENVYVGLNKQSTWYQYGFKEPQSPIKNSYLSPIVLNFRQYFIKQFSLKQPHSEKKQALLLVRKHNRKILNQDEVLQVISKNSGLKTFAIGLDSSSVLEVIEEILNSSLVIAMHGSLLILSLFLDHHSAVIELFPFGINPDISTPYKSLCEQYGLNLFYRSWPNDVQSNTFPHPEYPPEFGGISHLSSKEQEKIQNSVVKPFLCCDDPVWLYRIYQDTVVDTQSFGILLKDVILNQKRGFVVQNHPLYPGEIQNAQCNNLILEWKQPWNLRFLNVLGIEYEVWLQEVGGEDVKAYLMKTNKFVIPFKKTYHAWIRCHADGLIGPFTSSPVFCTVESSMTLSHLDSNG